MSKNPRRKIVLAESEVEADELLVVREVTPGSQHQGPCDQHGKLMKLTGEIKAKVDIILQPKFKMSSEIPSTSHLLANNEVFNKFK